VDVGEGHAAGETGDLEGFGAGVGVGVAVEDPGLIPLVHSAELGFAVDAEVEGDGGADAGTADEPLVFGVADGDKERAVGAGDGVAGGGEGLDELLRGGGAAAAEVGGEPWGVFEGVEREAVENEGEAGAFSVGGGEVGVGAVSAGDPGAKIDGASLPLGCLRKISRNTKSSVSRAVAAKAGSPEIW